MATLPAASLAAGAPATSFWPRGYASFRRAIDRFTDAEAYRLAASLSFYAISSLFPLMLVSISLGHLVLGDSPALQDSLVSALNATHSQALKTLLEQTLQSLREARGGNSIGIAVGALGSVFGASGIFLELDAALRKIFRSKGATGSLTEILRQTLRERATAAALVIATSVLLLFGTLFLSAIELVVAQIPIVADVFPGMASEAFSLAFSTAALSLCYWIVPNKKVRFGAALCGAIAAGVALHLARWPLTYLTLHVISYNAYGVVGTLLLLTTWIYVAGNVLLFGAAWTAVLSEGAPGPGAPQAGTVAA